MTTVYKVIDYADNMKAQSLTSRSRADNVVDYMMSADENTYKDGKLECFKVKKWGSKISWHAPFNSIFINLDV